MKLLSGSDLETARYFKSGDACPQGSSFDLRVGHIYGPDGAEVQGHFVLEPGHMVQVVSAEVFDLSDSITGHVTYKTSLTREGIWALTVGIVDPGWDGPVATTLLNFSSVSHTIHVGQAFLRVSLFEHEPIPAALLRKSKPLPDYLKEIQSFAATRFPTTFLNSDQIARDASKKVFDRIRLEGLAWLGGIVVVFTLIQVFAPPVSRNVEDWLSPSEVVKVQADLEAIKSSLNELEARLSEPQEAPQVPSALPEADGATD